MKLGVAAYDPQAHDPGDECDGQVKRFDRARALWDLWYGRRLQHTLTSGQVLFGGTVRMSRPGHLSTVRISWEYPHPRDLDDPGDVQR